MPEQVNDRGSTADHLYYGSEFMRRWFAAVEALSPDDCATILLQTSREAFVQVLRQVLPPADRLMLTDPQLHVLHDRMCERLQAKAQQFSHPRQRAMPAGSA